MFGATLHRRWLFIVVIALAKADRVILEISHHIAFSLIYEFPKDTETVHDRLFPLPQCAPSNFIATDEILNGLQQVVVDVIHFFEQITFEAAAKDERGDTFFNEDRPSAVLIFIKLRVAFPF